MVEQETKSGRWCAGYVVPNPDQYLFWDGTHPSRIGHELIGDGAYEALGETLSIPEPSTIGILLLAGASLLYKRSREKASSIKPRRLSPLKLST